MVFLVNFPLLRFVVKIPYIRFVCLFVYLFIWDRVLLLLPRLDREQWCHLSSLQPPPVWLKRVSCLRLPSDCDYRCAPPCLVHYFLFLVETGFYHVGQVSLELLTSGDPPSSVSQNAGIRGMGHVLVIKNCFLFFNHTENKSNILLENFS